MKGSAIAYHILRLSLAAVFLYFGFSQLFDGINWVGFVPQGVSDMMHLPPAMLVLGNGVFEVVAGTLIAMGLFVRILAWVLALHLLLITTALGFTPLGVRDFGLAMATCALGFLAPWTGRMKSVARISPPVDIAP